MEYTKEQISEYVLGWLGAGRTEHDINDIFAAISNAATCVKDPSDGIDAYVRRKEYYASIKY